MITLQCGWIVKVICYNGLIESGTVEFFDPALLVLKGPDGSTVYLNEPSKNILCARVSKANKPESQVYIEEPLALPEPEPRQDVRALKLAELYKLRAEEERKAAKALLSKKKITTIPEVKFGLPNFGPSFSKHPKKKT